MTIFIHFFCLCPLGLTIKLDFNISKVAYSSIRFDDGLTLETSAFESPYGGQLTLSTQLIKPNYRLNKQAVLINIQHCYPGSAKAHFNPKLKSMPSVAKFSEKKKPP